MHVAVHFRPIVTPTAHRVYSGEGARCSTGQQHPNIPGLSWRKLCCRAELSCVVEGYPQPTLTWWVEQLYKYLVAWRNVEKYRHGSLNVLKSIISLATKICYEGMSTNPQWASSPPPRRRGRQGFRLPWPPSPTTPPREPWTPPSPSPSPCSLNTSM